MYLTRSHKQQAFTPSFMPTTYRKEMAVVVVVAPREGRLGRGMQTLLYTPSWTVQIFHHVQKLPLQN